ncbi:hypothetical protein K2P47_01425 [Patescibacteria group bacterium]|nr:hypothetical protein [Patescibacteria group bacterium]
MFERSSKQFSSPEEEVQYLRERIAVRERELLGRTTEVDHADYETIAKQELYEYGMFTPKVILNPDHAFDDHDLASHTELIVTSHDPATEIVTVAFEKGIRNALTLLENVESPYVIDEVHRQLIEYIKQGRTTQDLKEGVPPWAIMHMSLFEVTLPELKGANDKEYQLADLVGMMEQLFAGMRSIAHKDPRNTMVFEIAVADSSEDIVFYTAVPSEFVTLFEKQTLSLFPRAVIVEQLHDYNIFVPEGTSVVADVTLKKHPIYPIRSHAEFTTDPLNVILNAFSKIEHDGSGAAMQFIIRYPKTDYRKNYSEILKKVQKGTKPKEAIARSTFSGELTASVSELFFTKPKKKVNSNRPKKSIKKRLSCLIKN